MMQQRSFPGRTFKVWDYAVSHQQMVIRSPGPDENGPHLDLHFRGVEFVNVPTILKGLSIVSPKESEVSRARELVAPRPCDPGMVWILESRGQRYMVVAARLDVAETDYPMMSTALIHPVP